MFSNSIFEALYLFKALYVNHAIATFIKDTPLIWHLLYLTFSYFLFIRILSIKDFSRSNFYKSHSGPVGFAKFIIISFIGLAILGYTKKTTIYDYKQYNWKKSKLIKTQLGENQNRDFYHYEVSVILYSIMQIISNIELTTTSYIDKTFNPTDKYSETPNGLYRAFVYAGYAQITDTKLQSKLNYYQENCINPILPKISNQNQINQLLDSSTFGKSNNKKILNLFKSQRTANGTSCYKLRNKVNIDLKKYLKIPKQETRDFLSRHFVNVSGRDMPGYKLTDSQVENFVISAALANHIDQKTDDKLIEKAANLDGKAGAVQGIKSSYFMYALGGSGSSSAAEQANNFSDTIKKAPHIKGFFLLILIGGFPILTFLVIAYGLKPLKMWIISYFLVSMWTPIWALLYAVNISFTKNAELVSLLQNFSDGVSMYSARAINSQILRSYSVFFVGQMGVVAVTLIGFLKPIFSGPAGDNTKDDAPNELKSAASTGAKFTSGGML